MGKGPKRISPGAGIGGLLVLNISGQSSQLACSDGNGNVTQLVDVGTGETSAAYEYDPFGKTINVSGRVARVNPFQFSSKYTDDETSYVYYGYRYYKPLTGAWLGRNPLEETVDHNLFQFVRNDSISNTDTDGRQLMPGQLPSPAAPPTEAEDKSELVKEQQDWRAQGWDFAANLLKAFYTQAGSYTASESDISKIKQSSEYRKEAQKHFQKLAKTYADQGTLGKVNVSDGKSGGNFAFSVQYTSGELLRALGGAHFYYTGTMYVCGSSPLQYSVFVKMTQEDDYTFGPMSYGLRGLVPIYMTARDLQVSYKYKPFTHSETWFDKVFNE